MNLETKLSIKCRLEQALNNLKESGTGQQYDPSWSRPKRMTREQIQDACIQAYHNIFDALQLLTEEDR